jgi:hypothetical protein
MDPALQRLRDAQKELASGITGTINSAITNLPQDYSARRQQNAQDVKDQKDLYDRRIEIQEGYLAKAATLEDKARIRKKIADLQAQKDSVSGESKGKTLFESLKTSVLQPIGGQIAGTFTKLLVTDPLQKQLEAQFKSLSEGDGLFAGLFRGAMGIKDPKTGALDAQTLAVQASTTALDTLANAANSAANAVRPGSAGEQGAASPATPTSTPLGQAVGGDQQPASTDPEAAQAIADARRAVDGMGKSTDAASSAVTALATAAGKGGGALSLFPSLLNMIGSAVSSFVVSLTASSAASGAGSSAGFWASLFGASSSSGAAASGGSFGSSTTPSSYIFHDGGVVGGSGVVRQAPAGIFAGAVRYHTGGIVGQKPDGSPVYASDVLKTGEVPAILMKNEEVLRADDPRHRDNLGESAFRAIMAGAKPFQDGPNNLAATGRGALHAATSVLQTVAGVMGADFSSAGIMGSLFDRLGVGAGGKEAAIAPAAPAMAAEASSAPDGQHTAVASAMKIAGAREMGGPVSPGQLYRVNEKGPELLNVAGKQYLMMGAQGGSVTPNNQLGGGEQRPIQQTVNFYNNGPIDRRTQAQLASAAYSGAARHSARNN